MSMLRIKLWKLQNAFLKLKNDAIYVCEYKIDVGIYLIIKCMLQSLIVSFTILYYYASIC